MDFFEAMDTNRAMRRLKPDPVPRELLEKLVHAATRAPSAGNSQHWSFVVVTNREDMRFLGDILQRRLGQFSRPTEDDAQGRMMRAVRYLIAHFHETPAVIFCCIRNAYPNAEAPIRATMWSTIFPATQNLLLAARALGLGAAMTTFQAGAEDEIKAPLRHPRRCLHRLDHPGRLPDGQLRPARPQADRRGAALGALGGEA